MSSSMTLAHRMRLSLRRRSSPVVLRAELAPLGSASQVSQALKALQDDGELLRLGAGVYAKARRDESTQTVMPVVDVETLGREVAHKLKAQVIDGGDGTLVLDTGDRRVCRKLALGQNAVRYVNDRNRRTATEPKGRAWNTATFPTTDVGNYVRWLAGFTRFGTSRRPPIMTLLILSEFRMSWVGSASSTTRSASLPGSRLPTSAS